MSELNQVKWGGKGSVVITGEPGSGKTHLLARLRKAVGAEAAYIYVRCNASAVTLWRHVRASLAGDLLKQEEGGPSQLQRILRQDPDRLAKVTSLTLQRVLKAYGEGRNVHAAAAWLLGETLASFDMEGLGIGAEKEEDEDRSRENEARLAVNGLLDFLAPNPVMLCFDQVEALQTYRGDEEGFRAMGTLISELSDKHSHLLLISCIVAAFEDQLDRLPNKADQDRWLQRKVSLRPIDWEAAVKLVRERLSSAPDLASLRSQHGDEPLYPLKGDDLKPLFEKTGLCLPRTLIQACKARFQSLFDDGITEQTRTLTAQDFLQEVYTAGVSRARGVVTSLGGDKTLSESLPWLLQNSGYSPLGQGASPSGFPSLAFRREGREFVVSLCHCRANTLPARLKKIDQFWKPGKTELFIVLDATIKPGAKGAQLLHALKSRGAKEVLPLPEALAALQAIRDMIASARSGDLRQDGKTFSESEVTDWALSNLPPQLEQLRDALAAVRPDAGIIDPTLSKLAALLKDRKVIEADTAARELSVSLEEVSACASRHPMRFGVLAGPPMVLFQAIEGASAQASYA
jgi:hypothetical protein